jgi:hypothetical protein
VGLEEVLQAEAFLEEVVLQEAVLEEEVVAAQQPLVHHPTPGSLPEGHHHTSSHHCHPVITIVIIITTIIWRWRRGSSYDIETVRN